MLFGLIAQWFGLHNCIAQTLSGPGHPDRDHCGGRTLISKVRYGPRATNFDFLAGVSRFGCAITPLQRPIRAWGLVYPSGVSGRGMLRTGPLLSRTALLEKIPLGGLSHRYPSRALRRSVNQSDSLELVFLGYVRGLAIGLGYGDVALEGGAIIRAWPLTYRPY